MWIYAFGSVVRGEVNELSDMDILMIGNRCELKSIPKWAQAYTKKDLQDIFESGDLFAYHLAEESALIFSSDGTDIVSQLGAPGAYAQWRVDFDKFAEVLGYAIDCLAANPTSVFHKGLLYMGCRDLAMIYSHVESGKANFSRLAPFHIQIRPTFDKSHYDHWRNCRSSSTRGTPIEIDVHSADTATLRLAKSWLDDLTTWRTNRD